jgi:GMP synthase (glutamine-hydrolysing)
MEPRTQKLILVAHDTQDRDDRASAWAEARGFALDWRCPAAGDALPALDGAAAVIVYGGRYDVREKHIYPFLKSELRFIEAALKAETPFLGLCLGGQLLAHVLGEDVGPNPSGAVEYGYYDLKPSEEGRAVFGDGLKVLQSHWHGWHATPKDAVALGGTALFPQQAFRYGATAYGLQFHPETTRATLQKWIARRPRERNYMPGAHPPERQLSDNMVHDAALGAWFEGFMEKWIGGQAAYREAAE